MKKIDRSKSLFPPTFDWITSRSETFQTRTNDPSILRTLADTFLRYDKGVQNTLKQNPRGWIVAITIGMDSVSISFYDPAMVDSPDCPHISTSSNLWTTASTVFMEIMPGGAVRTIDANRARKAVHSGAFEYCHRRLKAAEVSMLDSIQAAVLNNSAVVAVHQQEVEVIA